MPRVTTFLLVVSKLGGNSISAPAVVVRGAGNVVRNSAPYTLTLGRGTRPLQPKRITERVVLLSQDLIRMSIVVEGIIVIVTVGGKLKHNHHNNIRCLLSCILARCFLENLQPS